MTLDKLYSTYRIKLRSFLSRPKSKFIRCNVTAPLGFDFPNSFEEVLNHELMYVNERAYKTSTCNKLMEIYTSILLNVRASDIDPHIITCDTSHTALYYVHLHEEVAESGLPRVMQMSIFK